MQPTVLLLLAAGLCALPIAREQPHTPSRCMCTVDGGDSVAWLAFQREKLRDVDAVQLVRIEDVEWEDTVEVATARVLRSWKGPSSSTIRLATGAFRNDRVLTIGTCALRFRRGEEYLLFATRRPDGLYSTHRCSGTVLRADAAPILQSLDSAQIGPPEA